MMEPSEPKFQWGQHVRAAIDLYNDGTYPGRPVDALLVRADDKGEIVQVGRYVDMGVPIYLVQFGDSVVGCLEDEIHLPDAGTRGP